MSINDRLIKFFPPSLAILLLLIFAGSMSVATFIENDFGTATAWALVYNAWWFEVVMILLAVCFACNIYRYRLLRKEKISILLFHLAFIVILIGAGITRYTSYGGVMRIREGLSSNTIISSRNFIQAHINDNSNSISLKKECYFSPLKTNDFEINTFFGERDITISYNSFIADAAPKVVEDVENGIAILELVVATDNGRETIFLKDGEIQEIGRHKHKIAFNVKSKEVINIYEVDGHLYIRTPHPLDFFIMSTQQAGAITQDSTQALNLKTLYRSGDFSFVPLSYYQKARIDLVSIAEKPKDNDELKEDVLVVNLKVGEESRTINLLYRDGFLPLIQTVRIQNLDITLSYGAIPINLPFSVKLEDFQLERYPGSSSPSSYASEVVVLDADRELPYRIFMNNVLDHGGFRFYQASYDTDEKGTVLAVNHDVWGSYISYFGYLLMGIGMFWTLFGKSSRFSFVNKELKQLRMGRAMTILIILSLGSSEKVIGQQATKMIQTIEDQHIDERHAEIFGRIMVQDLEGRIKPLNSLASEFLRKISRKPYYKYKAGRKKVTLNADQTFLAMHVDPLRWKDIPLIKVDAKKGGELFKDLKTTRQELTTFNSFLDKNGSYILKKAVEVANGKKPAERNEFDKEVLLVDERFNILFNVFSGNYLKIFPKRGDSTKTWYSYSHNFADYPEEDEQFVQRIMPIYFNEIKAAKISNDWSKAENNLAYIKLYQDVLAKEIIPNDRRVEAELWYNQLNLNFWLFQAFWTLGFILLVIAVVRIFSQKKLITYCWNSLVVLSLISFIVFAGNIILRWYVAQHAPWSNGYEMIVFVSWVLMLFGILFYRKSDFVLPLATLFTGTLLFVSYLDWINPEITNLMPVLKSYWLKIHVATIVSSYAPLALSAILGLMVLILMIFHNKNNSGEITIRIKELTYINEIAMTIGLFLLAIGTFLGGIWANESWGRYWAWDPKETWALISTIIYAIVLHLRFIPTLRNSYTLNTASVFAFSSIVMTSFGVNYYLSGLHSYAAGDPLPIPKFVYVVVAVVLLVAVLAFLRNRKKSTAF